MGRGKQKQKAKRKQNAEKRRSIRLKMGKPVFLNLCRTPKPLNGMRNRYVYKANLYKVLYTNTYFYNVRWNASNLTYCSFEGVYCKGVDFVNSNLNNSSFKNATLENVMFFNCKLKNVNFENTKFKNVYFVSMNTKEAKKLDLDDNCKVYNTYPKLDIDAMLKDELCKIYKSLPNNKCNVLFVNENKLNLWTLQILYDNYGNDVYRALLALCRRKSRIRFFTVFSFEKHIVNYLKL